ncbi:MAG TPA: N-acetylmuramoyl-L-alanine amidase [Verrucomicrobiae bacterium]|nr:N-acetylmuramoyl-L-alanine amidase [Verrucomicrobiae bacterium]
MHRPHALIVSVFACAALGSSTDSQVVPQHRLSGGQYVAIRQLASVYELGHDRSQNVSRADYRTGSAELAVEADHRDIHLNGIIHWLSAPVLAQRGALWIRADDVSKTIAPVLRPPSLATKTSIRTIILDPGHGGADTGARGLSGHVEKEWTLDVARHVASRLADAGVRVLLTRETDSTTPLEGRPAFCLAHGGDVFVSIHFNSGGPTANGIETYCLTPAGSASTDDANARRRNDAQTGNRWDERNVWLAHCVHAAALSATGAADRGVRRARFEVLRDANCPAILIEGGFLTNQIDEQQVMNPEYRSRLAEAIAKGILAYKRGLETSSHRAD